MKAHPAVLLPVVILAISCTALPQGNDGYSRRSLFGLTGIQVMVEVSLPPAMTGTVTDAELEVEAERVLKRAGINVIDREKANPLPGRPKLYFRVQAVQSPELPLNAFSIETGIAQKVQLARDSSINVDAITWSVYAIAVIESSNLKQAAKTSIDRAADEFISAFREQNPKK